MRWLRAAGLFLVGLLAILLIAIASLWWVVDSSYGQQRIAAEANRTLQKTFNRPVISRFSEIDIGLRGGWRLAIHLRDVSILSPDTPVPLASVETLDLVLSPLSLLQGRLELRSLALEGGRLEAGLLTPEASTDIFQVIRNDAGQIDPDRLTETVIGSTRFLRSRIESVGIKRIELERLTIAHGLVEARIENATVRRASRRERGLTFEAALELRSASSDRSYPLTIDASAWFTPDEKVRELSALVRLADMHLQATPRSHADLGGIAIEIDATEMNAAAPGRMDASLTIDRYEVKPEPHDRVEGSFFTSVRMGEGSGKAEIIDGMLQIGKTRLPLDGAVGPGPERSEEGTPLYRFELLSNDASVNARDSGLPQLKTNLLVRGIYDPLLNVVTGRELAMNLPGGHVEGWFALALVDPFFVGLSLRSDYLETDDLKRLWPYTVAPEARKFVLRDVTGGAGRQLSLDVAAPLPELLDPETRRTDEEMKASLLIDGVTMDLPDELPPLLASRARLDLVGTKVTLDLEEGSSDVDGKSVRLGRSTLALPDAKAKPLRSQLSLSLESDADVLAELAQRKPIGAVIPLGAESLSGKVVTNVEADLILGPTMGEKPVSAFAVSGQFSDAALDGSFEGHTVGDADGTFFVDPSMFTIRLAGKLDGLDASLALIQPKGGVRDLTLKARVGKSGLASFAPALAPYVGGSIDAEIRALTKDRYAVALDLRDAALNFPPLGWSKGIGVPGKASLNVMADGRILEISELDLQTGATAMRGSLMLENGRLKRAAFPEFAINGDDEMNVSLQQEGKSLRIEARGSRFDARPIIRRLTAPAVEKQKNPDAGISLGETIELDAMVGRLGGFAGEVLNNAKITFSGSTEEPDHAVLSAVSKSGRRMSFTYEREANRRLEVTSGDAGALLRFGDLYARMAGGKIRATLSGGADQPMTGNIDISNFTIVDEPRLDSLASRPVGADGASLNDRTRVNIDTSYVSFDSGSVSLVKSKNRLDVSNGVLRGPQIGMMFDGTVYDSAGNMNMTGTFMPAYGLNRLFGEIPVLGAVLGNGREKGLIGVTYRLSGSAKDPKLTINPLSVIAPGIFRSIFAFR